MNKVTPFLWFDGDAHEATKFYLSIFKDSKLLDVKKKGRQVVSTTFRLNGQEFIALNGGPHFKFTPAISFFVRCKTQREVDYYWEKLSKGGSKSCCGWLKDKYGLSWQIVPDALGEQLWRGDAATKERVWDAMMKMKKLDIAALKLAAKKK